MRKVGLVLGKFMPPHAGHVFLCSFAKNYVDELIIVVGTQPSEDTVIPGHLRFEWMQSLFPQARVVHLHRELPQYPEEHPDFWNIWKEALNSVLPDGLKPTHVLASEPYCVNLAAYWDAQPVLVDQERTIVQISATKIRQSPRSYWDYLPAVVRPYYLKKICIVGPESSGKTVLVQRLAAHYQTAFIPEFAKNHIALNGWPHSPADMDDFVHGQLALQQAAIPQAHGILFCDTDPLTTLVWSEFLFDGLVSPYVQQKAEEEGYDLYLLVTPYGSWVDDIHRQEGLVDREAFFKHMKEKLEQSSRKFVTIDATDWDARLGQAIDAVTRLGVHLFTAE